MIKSRYFLLILLLGISTIILIILFINIANLEITLIY